MNTPEDKSELRFPFLTRLYPNRSIEELREADYRLSKYLEIVIRIYRRTQVEEAKAGAETDCVEKPLCEEGSPD